MEEPILGHDEVVSCEWETRRKYSGETGIGYSADTVSRRPIAGSDDYFDRLLEIRLALARELARDANVLDVGCATGIHLFDLAPGFKRAIGLDFSFPLVKRALETRTQMAANVDFVEGNARCMPFCDGSFDFIYSFSSLYYMPNVGEVIREICRVLAPGGRCLIELGNSRSLNAIVTDAYPELARSFHIPVSQMNKALSDAGLKAVAHRAFQILPYWGERPRRLDFWLHPAWKRRFEKCLAGRMIDEWICSFPWFRNFAFRHVFVCVKK